MAGCQKGRAVYQLIYKKRAARLSRPTKEDKVKMHKHPSLRKFYIDPF
jgi:hypothetical protein